MKVTRYIFLILLNLTRQKNGIAKKHIQQRYMNYYRLNSYCRNIYKFYYTEIYTSNVRNELPNYRSHNYLKTFVCILHTCNIHDYNTAGNCK